MSRRLVGIVRIGPCRPVGIGSTQALVPLPTLATGSKISAPSSLVYLLLTPIPVPNPRSVVSLWAGPSNCSPFQTLPCRSVSSYPLLPFLSSVSAFLLPDLENFAVLVELLHPAMVSVRHDVRSGRGVDTDRYLYFLSSFLSWWNSYAFLIRGILYLTLSTTSFWLPILFFLMPAVRSVNQSNKIKAFPSGFLPSYFDLSLNQALSFTFL